MVKIERILLSMGIGRGRRIALRKLVARGDAARDSKRWQDAAQAYAEALRLDVSLVGIRIQYGHALKESGDHAGAETAYRAAIALDRANAENWLQLGHVLKLQGRQGEAVEAYREALSIDPLFNPAHRELIGLGARSAVPIEAVSAVFGEIRSEGAARLMSELADRIDRVMSLAAHPRQCYEQFRAAFPILPPPEVMGNDDGAVRVEVDGRSATPAAVRATIDALIDQSLGRWQAFICVGPEIAKHPVASMAHIDVRIAFGTEWPTNLSGSVLLMDAGTILDPQALIWFLFAAARTDCGIAYCDHDQAIETWRGPRRHLAPVLQPAFDPDWFDDGLSDPAVLFLASRVPADRHEMRRGRLLCRMSAEFGGATHIPRILASVLDLRTGVLSAPSDASDITEMGKPLDERMALPGEPQPISVIIPTRDQGALLERCVQSLIEKARIPRRVEIVIVDNRSRETATAAILRWLSGRPGTRIMTLDEPFNWSRVNNLAIANTVADQLILLNNDTEMLTEGWDLLVDRYLACSDCGLIGARLLYPDRTVQHAGIVFGRNDGAPMHEGVGKAEDDGGPEGRWLRRRAVAAVTGAFMAVRRATLAEVGGFDELSLPVGYNDVDMCLRVRASGRRVIYAPDIQLIHHESKTRGHNVSRSQVAWDRGELRALYQRWGDRLLADPYLNLHWALEGPPFEAFREPAISEILAYMDRSALSGDGRLIA